jgi:ribosomal-protein-alanine N-acetyltransferase
VNAIADGPLAIRSARSTDLDRVSLIERAVFADPWSRRSFSELLDTRHVIFLVGAGQADQAVGYAVVVVAGPESELANLAVDPVLQGRGIGRWLLAAAMGAARERGSTEMFLEVRASNAAAIALYEGCGFRPIGRRARYYARPVEDAIVMRGDLPALTTAPGTREPDAAI